MTSYDYTQKKLTLQSWNITPKIRVLDELLAKHEGWVGHVHRVIRNGYSIG